MSNAFETGARKVIPAVLVYVKCADRVLMIHRDSGRPGDYHAGKWNGLGGKLEPDESAREGAVRELWEESGLRIPAEDLRALGVLHFPNFKAHKNEDWIATVFVARLASRPDALIPSGEGSLHWVPASDLLTLNLWAGDREFIPHVVSERPFLGTIWYAGERVVRSEVEVL